MQLHYTDHAMEMMKFRNVTKQQIELCVNSPQETYPDTEGHIQYAHNFEDGRLIRVVIKQKGPNHGVVLTVKD
jgi:hypothetical protein